MTKQDPNRLTVCETALLIGSAVVFLAWLGFQAPAAIGLELTGGGTGAVAVLLWQGWQILGGKHGSS